MNNPLETLGKILESPQERDAVHIAIAPVICGPKPLFPGNTIGFISNDSETVGHKDRDRAIGIVDPFLKQPIEPGERFWMFLYPNTVENVRHEWSHPAFKISSSDKKASEAWLRDFTADLDITYHELIEGAADYLNEGHMLELGFNDTPEIIKEKSVEFWHHYYIVTGDSPSHEENFNPSFIRGCCY